jgi:transposase-like protein
MAPAGADDPRHRLLSFGFGKKGVRSERALKLAVAQMYVQGVSTRKVTAVMQELCGTEVTSSGVSRACELLEGELESWRNRPLGEIETLFSSGRHRVWN